MTRSQFGIFYLARYRKRLTTPALYNSLRLLTFVCILQNIFEEFIDIIVNHIHCIKK